MGSSLLHVEIVTPSGTVYRGDADCVTLQTEQGIMQIKPGHADLMGVIEYTPIRVDYGSEQEHILGRRGVVHVDNTTSVLRVLLSYADHFKHVHIAEVKDYLLRVDSLLATGQKLSDFHITFLNEEKIALESMVRGVDGA